MSKIIGIDLGSTLSEVAVVEGGKPTIIVNEEGLIKNLYKNHYGKKLTGVEYRGDIIICPKELVE